MKVWYVLMAFPIPSETFVANDVRALSRLGVDVSVHAFRGPRPDADRLLRERHIEHIRVTHGTPTALLRGVAAVAVRPLTAVRLVIWLIRHSRGRLIHFAKGLALLPRAFGLLECLEREHPDVVHIYWGHYPSIFGWLVLERVPDVLVSLSLSAYDLVRAFPGSAAVAKRAHTVSTWAAANLPAISALGIPADSIYVSWQGVDLELVKKRRFNKTPRRLVTAGRLIAEKGMDDVVRAFTQIVAAHADARLIILGDGPDRDRLRRLAADLKVAEHIDFRGHVSHDDVFEELSCAEVFLFLSSYRGERLPNVVKESMACRCVVITTDTIGIEELIQDGVNGWIIPRGAWERAAALATQAFANPEAAKVMADAAQNSVLAKFDAVRLMEAMIRHWKQRLGACRRRA